VRRLAALAYESLIVAAIVLVAGFALTPLMSPVAGPGHALVLPSPFGRAAGFVALVAILGAYAAIGWSRGRRTLPMKTWRLALVDVAGAAPTRQRALARYAAAWIGPLAALSAYAVTHSPLSALLLGLNHGWALVDRDRQFLHDRLAGTRLVTDA
jgi:uncharacterized RDD family membrane protein YckC